MPISKHSFLIHGNNTTIRSALNGGLKSVRRQRGEQEVHKFDFIGYNSGNCECTLALSAVNTRAESPRVWRTRDVGIISMLLSSPTAMALAVQE